MRRGGRCAPPAYGMDRFKQIETFAAVAAKGSLSAAAHAEGVAPAIIGRRLDALEERLGVKLL
ncbi:helix-turn-helix domain-containing protein, partial [Burkholderia mallei]|uniref:helix-turn-helix domain-containing protein n=1 Tax=Burkholderia mallei TaxID=13373 RepID=UPI001E5C31F7